MGETIFLAGASGAIGRRLLPLLTRGGHVVVGATRSPERAARLAAVGGRPVLVDVLDANALMIAVCEVGPSIVINQLTDLSGMATDPERARRANARLRREGTANLMRAAARVGARRVIAQSIAWAYAPGAPPYGEDHALDLKAEGMRGTTIVEGIAPLEQATLQTRGVEGLVLRYGQLYGPGTWFDTPEGLSPVHVDAAAHACALAIERGAPGAYNIVEDGAEASNAKAVMGLGWRPDFRL